MAMIALYSSIFALIALLFSYIDQTFPDALNYYVDPYSSGMRIQIATLLVMMPLFLVIMRFIRKDIERDSTRGDIWIRRWALYLTVFLAGLTVIVDLITLVNYFLGGEITTRFIFKVLVVLGIAGVAFMHFLADIWGYWNKFPERARYVGWGIGALVLLTIGAGFFIMGSPSQIRMYRFDDQKVEHMSSIQWQLVNYFQQKEKLPASLQELADPISGYALPVDPQTGAPYTYRVVEGTTFEICATFNAPTQPGSMYGRGSSVMRPADPILGPTSGEDLNDATWHHDAGEKCFTRTIDPERYPPYSAVKK